MCEEKKDIIKEIKELIPDMEFDVKYINFRSKKSLIQTCIETEIDVKQLRPINLNKYNVIKINLSGYSIISGMLITRLDMRKYNKKAKVEFICHEGCKIYLLPPKDIKVPMGWLG